VSRRQLVATGLVLLAALVAPWGMDDYALGVLTIAFYYAVLAVSWNLLAGHTGQFSLAQQGFAALGAYATGLSIHYLALPVWLGICLAAAVSCGMGLALGLLTLRLRAIYLAITTWGFAETVHITLTAGYQVTRGQLGLSVPTLLGNLDPLPYYYVFLGLLVASQVLLYAVYRSRIGRFLHAVRDDQLRAASLGVDTTRWKLFAFALSSTLTGLAGAFYAHYVAVIGPDMADFSELAKIVVMVVIGGMGTFAGPVVGAIIVQLLIGYLGQFGAWDNVAFALAVILLMRTQREGLVALVVRAWRRLVAWVRPGSEAVAHG
jgi:branched-chain amino acid transport system permease protein